MHRITAAQIDGWRHRFIDRRRMMAGTAVASAAMVAARAGSVFAATPEASPTAAPEGTPFSGNIVRNPWEPVWSAEPPFFTLIDRNPENAVIKTIGDGLVEAPANAARIFSASGEEDVFLALGQESRLVGLVADGSETIYTNQTIVDERLPLADLATYPSQWEPNLEIVLGAKPDLIVGSSPYMISDELYPQFAQVAPTVRYPSVTFIYPRQAVHDYGILLGVEDAATEALASYNATMQRARELVGPVVGDAEVLVAWYQGEGMFVVYTAWTRAADGRIEVSSSDNAPYHFELGLRSPDAIEAQADEDRSQSYLELSIEQLGQVPTDWMFMLGDPAQIEDEVLSSPLIQRMPSFVADQVVVVDGNADTGLGYYGNLARVAMAMELFTGESL
ncbi:MAG: ABC transporter substrate-binding protein [Thermomicrobiales bacterium]